MTATPVRGHAGGAGVAVALLLLLTLTVVAARSDPWAAERPSRPVAVQPLPSAPAPTPLASLPSLSPKQTAEHLDSGFFQAVAAALALLLAACVVAAGWLFWPRLGWRWRWWRRPVTAGEQPPDEPAPTVAEAVDRALLLVEHPDAREAVVRAWLLLGTAAAAAGTPARPTETSRDYARRLAEAQRLPRTSVERLAGLYREARFSTHEMRPGQREQARADLLALRAALHPEGAGVGSR